MSSSESNSNSKFRNAPSVDDFSGSNENNYSCWDTTKAIEELKNFGIDTENKTLSEVLKEIHQVEKKYFDIYDKGRGYIPAAAFLFSDKYLEIQNIKYYLNEMAIWLYNGKFCEIPSSLLEQMMYENNAISSLNTEQTNIEPHFIDIVNWIFAFSGLSDKTLIATFNRNVGIRYWGLSRSRYIRCLKNEILDRAFNSEVLFDGDSSGNEKAFKLGKKVRLVKGVLVIDN
jgi:hypothetical protein